VREVGRLNAARAYAYDRVMITCVVKYVLDPSKLGDFEEFARAWMTVVERHGGIHHGYFLPASS
jgi:hypothetical protein